MITPPKLCIAVPKYMEEKALKANMPPGHRFNLYAPMWVKEVFLQKEKVWGIGEDISANKERNSRLGGKAETLRKASEKYADEIKKLLENTYNRQSFLAQKLDALVIPIKLTAPFAVGLGNDHPVENGFSFLSPYGLPYIAGSGIKGVLRNAAQESGVTPEEIEILFGKEDQNDATRGALTIWDGFPQCDKMTVEVMTPHQSDYYQGKSSPHDQGTPTPIQFLAVPANTNMNLIIQCDKTRLKLQDYDWQGKVIEIVNYASKWLGLGAKTSVGYGSFIIEEKWLKEYQNKLEAIKEQKRIDSLTPEEKLKEEAKTKLKTLIKDYEKIKVSDKVFKKSNSRFKPLLKEIYSVGELLRDEDCKSLFDDILKFVNNDKDMRKEVKQKRTNLFG